MFFVLADALLSTARYRTFPPASSLFSRLRNPISVIKRGINLNLNAITLIHLALDSIRLKFTVPLERVSGRFPERITSTRAN